MNLAESLRAREKVPLNADSGRAKESKDGSKEEQIKISYILQSLLSLNNIIIIFIEIKNYNFYDI